jgi:hypothetical protein
MFGLKMIFLQKSDSGSSLTEIILLFDFPYGGTNVNASTYIDAANTNLFYMNNIMHDVYGISMDLMKQVVIFKRII